MEKSFKLTRQKKINTQKILKEFIVKRDEIIFSYIHGSFIDAFYFHDLDIAVYVREEGLKKDDALDYEFALSAELEPLVGFPVDVKVLNYAPLGFRYYVTKGELLTSLDEQKRADFLEDVWMKYLDMEYFIKEDARRH